MRKFRANNSAYASLGTSAVQMLDKLNSRDSDDLYLYNNQQIAQQKNINVSGEAYLYRYDARET